jgi:hypothetical protein
VERERLAIDIERVEHAILYSVPKQVAGQRFHTSRKEVKVMKVKKTRIKAGYQSGWSK